MTDHSRLMCEEELLNGMTIDIISSENRVPMVQTDNNKSPNGLKACEAPLAEAGPHMSGEIPLSYQALKNLQNAGNPPEKRSRAGEGCNEELKQRIEAWKASPNEAGTYVAGRLPFDGHAQIASLAKKERYIEELERTITGGETGSKELERIVTRGETES